MDKRELDPELEQLISKVKLKEAPQELMRDYLSGVNAKINQGMKEPYFGFPQFAVVCVVGLALAGLIYFVVVHGRPVTPVPETVREAEVVSPHPSQPEVFQQTLPKLLSIEEEMAVLETFAEEHSEDTAELFGDEEVFEELAQLDEAELSTASSIQTPQV